MVMCGRLSWLPFSCFAHVKYIVSYSDDLCDLPSLSVIKRVSLIKNVQRLSAQAPLPSSRRFLSYGDCLEDEREDYQNCSVLCCVQQLCTMIHTHT